MYTYANRAPGTEPLTVALLRQTIDDLAPLGRALAESEQRLFRAVARYAGEHRLTWAAAKARLVLEAGVDGPAMSEAIDAAWRRVMG